MRCCLLIAIVLWPLWTAAVVASELTGRVRNTRGEPIEGATVYVSTAAPREGVAVFCPSCYLDCGKKARTDAEGRFTIGELDPTLVFYLVATADGHRAGSSKKIDPAKDKAEMQLEPLPADLPPEQIVRGRVVDVNGKPVVGADVRPFGCRKADRRWWGSLPGVDGVSITNDEGRFIITAREPAEAFDLEVRSPRHAPRRFALQPTGGKDLELPVEEGAIVRGRLVKDGKPIEGVSVGLVQTDRSSDGFLGETMIGTNSKGEFQFTFVAPENDFYVYTIMDSMDGRGALPLKRVSVGETGSLVDLADLSTGAAHTLAGQIVLTDGKPLPQKIQILLTREGAWDSQRSILSGDGRFRFENVPNDEPMTFVARVPGYRLAPGRNRFQQVRENSIAMFVAGPRDDIEIFYEPDDKKK